MNGLSSFVKNAGEKLRSFFPSSPSLRRDDIHKPFVPYRTQATELNYKYIELYRGTFLSNYIMAILAVSLAAVSLLLLTDMISNIISNDVLRFSLLLTLGAFKLVIVICIFLNTKQANDEKWNEKAIDYRYLAERLRSMYYLPLAGSHQPPKSIPFASREIRQGAAFWLFNALIRAISPADLENTKNDTATKEIPTSSAQDVVTQVRDFWIGEQIKYHEGNAATMEGMNAFIEKTASNLNRLVIAIVTLDLILIAGELFHCFPEWGESLANALTPWLIMISIILPAIIASLSGIRSQTECQRLARRSKIMRENLEKHYWALADQMFHRISCDKQLAHSQPAYSRPLNNADSYSGSWALDSLHLTEHVAMSFSQEISEWSVLYAKEVSDPG